MKSPYRLDLLLFVVAALSAFLRVIIDYLGGRQNFPITFLHFPAGTFPLLLSVICLLGLLVRVALSRSIKIASARSGIFCLSLVVFLFSWIYFSPPKVFLLGLRDELRSRGTVSDLEASVSAVRQHPEDHTRLIQNSDFLTDYQVQQDDDSTSVYWGGGFGHWGIRYSETPAEKSLEDVGFLPLSKHTGLFYSD